MCLCVCLCLWSASWPWVHLHLQHPCSAGESFFWNTKISERTWTHRWITIRCLLKDQPDTFVMATIPSSHTHIHTQTYTHTVGPSIRRHLPHKGQHGLGASATTATARNYGTRRIGMGVQFAHDCHPVCVSESCGLVSPTGPSTLLLSHICTHMLIWTQTHTCALFACMLSFLT